MIPQSFGLLVMAAMRPKFVARETHRVRGVPETKIGKPRGSMNKKTIERLQQMQKEKEQKQRVAQTPPSTASGETDTTPPCAASIPPLPSSNEDSTFREAQSRPKIQESFDTHSAPSFTFHSSPSQHLTLPGDELHGIEDWLAIMTDDSIENVGSRLLRTDAELLIFIMLRSPSKFPKARLS
ncbi:hypothetical protein B7463_g3505, partial [Scytalidium lignicola]